MERRRLGAHGPEISAIGYGAWGAGGDMWGPEVPAEQVTDAMHAAIDAGVNWIDTAEAYGDGRSELLVGEVIRDRRDEVLVFTKVAPFASGTRPSEVRKAIEGSLERLGADVIDLYQVHWPDEERVPVEETWGAMAACVDDGLARWIGVSNFDRDLVERCLTVRHVDSVQNEFSLLDPEDPSFLAWLQEQGIGYLAYGPLAYGLLTGAVTRDTTFAPDDWRSGSWNLGYYERLFAPGVLERRLDTVDALRAIADREGIDLATLALRALIATPGVTAAIAGSRNPEHVRSNAVAGDAMLSDQTLLEVYDALAEPDRA
jgi:aryl-alcohol dehydrogenase-like predicted oxidoreductase